MTDAGKRLIAAAEEAKAEFERAGGKSMAQVKAEMMTDAPERIWAGEERGSRWHYGYWDLCGQSDLNDRAGYTRDDLVPRWSDDMDAAPKDGAPVLTFHPANPKAIIERARRDNIVWNEWRGMSWYRSLPEQPPTHWMRVDPPKEGE